MHFPVFQGQRSICDDEQTHKVCMMSVCNRVHASKQDSELGRVGGVHVRRLLTVGTDGGSSNLSLAVLTNHMETKLSVL